VVRRIVAGFFVILGATFVAYVLVANAGDPLENARSIPNVSLQQQTMTTITQTLHLNINPVARYFLWLKGVGGCLIGNCDFGVNIQQIPVNQTLSTALLVSLRLIAASVVLSVVFGIAIGIVTALRQYSGLDYSVTFVTFVFFALPTFWFGVVLKDLFAIRFNTFLQHGATFTWGAIIVVSLLIGVIAYSLFGGERIRRLTTGAVAFGVSVLALYYVTVSHWLLDPSLGPVIIAVVGAALGLGVTSITSGFGNRRALYASMTTVLIGVLLWYPLQFFFANGMSFLRLMVLLIIALGVGIAVGYLYGGDDKGLSARVGALTAFSTAFVIFADRMLRAWHAYSTNPAISGRPIRTTLPATPNIKGDFWILTTDTLTHLVLPTVTLMLISLATHSRFARASMLEVMNMDYIRTARSKGLTERTVVMRHAFRNALIPMATVVALDIAGVIGGAVITEKVFGWKSMGTLFQDGLTASDPNPVMAFMLVGAVVTVVVNLLADFAYAALDPRIRVGS